MGEIHLDVPLFFPFPPHFISPCIFCFHLGSFSSPFSVRLLKHMVMLFSFLITHPALNILGCHAANSSLVSITGRVSQLFVLAILIGSIFCVPPLPPNISTIFVFLFPPESHYHFPLWPVFSAHPPITLCIAPITHISAIIATIS